MGRKSAGASSSHRATGGFHHGKSHLILLIYSKLVSKPRSLVVLYINLPWTIYIYTYIYIYLPFIYHTPSNSPNSQCPTGTSKNHVVLSCCRPLISPLKPGNSRILKWRYFSTIFWAKLGAYPHRNFGPGKSALYMVGTSNFGWNGHWYYENASDRMIH